MGCPSKPLPALCVAPVPVETGPEVADAAAGVPEWIVHSSPIEHAGYPLPVVGRVVAHKDRPAAAEVLPEPGRETLSNFRAPAQLGWATRCASCSPPGCPAPPRPCGSGRRRRWCLPGADVTRATELARPIARQTLPGVRAISASARAGLGHGPDAGHECTALLLPGILRSQDAVEGLQSFIGRREGGFRAAEQPAMVGR